MNSTNKYKYLTLQKIGDFWRFIFFQKIKQNFFWRILAIFDYRFGDEGKKKSDNPGLNIERL